MYGTERYFADKLPYPKNFSIYFWVVDAIARELLSGFISWFDDSIESAVVIAEREGLGTNWEGMQKTFRDRLSKYHTAFLKSQSRQSEGGKARGKNEMLNL